MTHEQQMPPCAFCQKPVETLTNLAIDAEGEIVVACVGCYQKIQIFKKGGIV